MEEGRGRKRGRKVEEGRKVNEGREGEEGVRVTEGVWDLFWLCNLNRSHVVPFGYRRFWF